MNILLRRLVWSRSDVCGGLFERDGADPIQATFTMRRVPSYGLASVVPTDLFDLVDGYAPATRGIVAAVTRFCAAADAVHADADDSDLGRPCLRELTWEGDDICRGLFHHDAAGTLEDRFRLVRDGTGIGVVSETGLLGRGVRAGSTVAEAVVRFCRSAQGEVLPGD